MRTINTLDELEAIVTKLQAEGKRVYVRYSRHPVADCKRGYSINHANGDEEAGLSCNSLQCPSWYPVNGRKVRGYLAMQVGDYSYMRFQGGAKGWLLTGTYCGRGSDNEALVSDARPVAYISDTLIEECKRYDQ